MHPGLGSPPRRVTHPFLFKERTSIGPIRRLLRGSGVSLGDPPFWGRGWVPSTYLLTPDQRGPIQGPFPFRFGEEWPDTGKSGWVVGTTERSGSGETTTNPS